MILRALIFDVDGTLAETEELHRQAFNETFPRFDLDWHWSSPLYRELLQVTGGKERIRFYRARYRPDEGDLAPARVADIHLAKTERYAALVENGALTLRPGVARLLTEAKVAGLRLAIATTTSRPNVTALLRRTQAPFGEAGFDVIVAGDEVARKKPWPDVYERALRELDLSSDACVAVEDSAPGVLAARRAGIPVLATPSAYTEADTFDGAFSVVSDLGEPWSGHRHLGGLRWDGALVTCEGMERSLNQVSRLTNHVSALDGRGPLNGNP